MEKEKHYVYFIQESKNKKAPIKIGMSKNPDLRLSNIQTSYPYELQINIMIECKSKKDARKMEVYLHRMLKKQRLNGEWFKPYFNLKGILDKYPKFGGKVEFQFASSQVSIKSLKRENKELKQRIKQLESDVDEMLDKQFLNAY